MGRRALAALGFAVLFVAQGCGGLEPRQDPPPPAGRVSDRPVSVLETTRTYEPTAPGKARGSLRPALDGAAISDHVARLLRARASAPEVAVVASSAQAAAGSPILQVALESAVVRYEGQSGTFALKVAFIVCFFPLDVPNYFIASDRYTLVARGTWKLVDPETAHTIAEGEAEGRETGIFGDMSRGWHFIGFVRSPGCLDPEDWDKIATVLRPGAEEAFATSVVVNVERAVAAAQAPAKAPDAAAGAARSTSGE